MDDLTDTEDAGVARDTVERPPRRLEIGDELGRYVILRKLGVGAMGTVYLGYDPELDRKVALKVLRGLTSPGKRQALLREAQAMARLTHPNVVSVYDVGEQGGRVYVAMEFVEGETLARWLRAEPRRWREILDVFLCAGRGLEAAHAHALIHRDFKPENVMLTHGGEVRVMDFGLARPSTSKAETQDGGEPPELGADLGDAPGLGLGSRPGSLLTEATVGTIAGTPAYMAPEQIAAQKLAPASDQFAFCVSLWEGLCGERPFDGRNLGELYTRITAGALRPAPASLGLPRWLLRVLSRGLAAHADERWPSMSALLQALERGRRRWRMQAALAALGGLVLVAGLGLGWRSHEARALREQAAACEAVGSTIYEVWDGAARERLRAGLEATGASFAGDSADILIPWLDDYRDAWSEGRSQVCVHAEITRDWDAELLDRAAWCFEDRRLQLEATAEGISHLDRKAARRAVRIATYLDPIETCLEPDQLRKLPLPPPARREAFRALRRELTEAEGLHQVGKYAESLVVARRVRAQAEQLDWPPLLAHARLVEGRCLSFSGRSAEAGETLTRAYFEARGAGANEVAFRAARGLMSALSSDLRFREAEIWGEHAELLASGLTDPSGLDSAEGHYLRMRIYMGQGKYARAAAEGERAEAMRAQGLGPRHPITAAATRSLGRIYLRQGRLSEALPLFERASAIWEDAVGHEHPYIGELLTYRAMALLELGRVDEALPLALEGLAVHERSLRPDHPKLILDLDALAQIQLARGARGEAEATWARARDIRGGAQRLRGSVLARSELTHARIEGAQGQNLRALERCSQALALLESTVDPGDLALPQALEHLAHAHAQLGQLDAARARIREAVARWEAAAPGSERMLIRSLGQLAEYERLGHRPDAARSTHTRALALAEGLEAEPELAAIASAVALAELALEAGDVARARALATRAVRAAERGGGPRLAGRAHWILARALLEVLEGSPSSPRRPRDLALRAQDEFERSHDHQARAEVEAWLSRAPLH